MAENPLGIILSITSLGFGGMVVSLGWRLHAMRWIGGIGVVAGVFGLAQIAVDHARPPSPDLTPPAQTGGA